MVVRRASRAGRAFPDGAGRGQLARAVLIAAAAAVELLGERTQLVVLRAVQERLEVTQPVGLGPGQKRGRRNR